MRKTCVLMLVWIVVVAFTAAAGGQGTPEGPPTLRYNGNDVSKEVHLYGYLLGAPPAGFTDVMSELNKRFKRDINATMEINYIAWSDFQSKYALLLAAGENIDWIFTAPWSFYTVQAAKGAFAEITLDMVQKYMPNRVKNFPKDGWNDVRVNGKIYMAPQSHPASGWEAAILRGDLRKKYNVPEVKKFSDLGPYLNAIKKNEPDMIPFILNGSHDYQIGIVSLCWEYGPGARDVLGLLSSGILKDWDDPKGKIVSIFEEPYFTAFRKAAATMKSWYDNGYINRNVFANNLVSIDTFVEGKTAVCYANTTSMQSPMAAATTKGYYVEIVPSLSGKGTCPAPTYLCNGFAVAAASKNMERTLMAMDLIMDDESYNYLAYFGVEGKHWVLKDGKLALPQGVTSETTTYPWDAAGFWFTNTAQFKPLASWTPEYIAHKAQMEKASVSSALWAWALDEESVKTELANMKDVWVQYGNPIEIGAVSDVDAALAILKEKLTAAGMDKVLAEARKQASAYLVTRK